MARPDHVETRPFTRQGESAGGHKRGLPIVSPSGSELRVVHLSGHLNPDASVVELRNYLGVGIGRQRLTGYSRNFR